MAIADLQDGVFSHEQAVACGLSASGINRRTMSGAFRTLHHGIFTLDRRPSWLALAWAGLLIGGPNAALGGASAAYLQGWAKEPGRFEIWVGPSQRPRTIGRWWFRRGERWASGSPPRVSGAQATIDLLGVADRRDVVGLLTSAVSSRQADSRAIRGLAWAQTNLKNRRLILDILGDVDAGAESPLEILYLNNVERAHGLPEGARQSSVSRNSVTDVHYEFGLLVELDGRVGHTGVGTWRDYRRDNQHVVQGYANLRYGWDDVLNRACQVARQVESVAKRLGWRSSAHPCKHCARWH